MSRFLSSSAVLLMLSCVVLPPAAADTVSVAVASNFLAPLRALSETFERQSGHRLRISSGSTGKLYAQIAHGAPFDVFLAANEREPARLEREGLAAADSRFTYALGRLVLWSRAPDRIPGDGAALLQAGSFGRLAIANPKTAPYGAAAMAVLRHLGLAEALAGKLVRGENIGQAFQYVASGNVELGLVAFSQVLATEEPGSVWQVPDAWYPPIAQQAVLLERAQGAQAAEEFLAFLKSDAVRRELMARFGYGMPAKR